MRDRTDRGAGRRRTQALLAPYLALCLLSLIAVSLAYQRVVPFRLDLDGRADGWLLEGFHAPESSPSGPFRWTGAEAHLRLPAMWVGRDLTVACVLSAPRPQADGQAAAMVPVQLLANGRPVATWDAGAGPADYMAVVPRAFVGSSGDVDLAIVSPTYAPAGDLRSLGALVARLEVAPAAGLPATPSTRALFGVTALVLLAYGWCRRLSAAGIAAPLAVALLALCALGLLLARPFTPPMVERLLFLGIVAWLGSEVAARLAGMTAPRDRRALAALFLVAFAVRLTIAHTPGDHDNFIAFKMMIENVTRNGIAAAYEIDPVIGAYPPLHHYFLAISGLLYRAFLSPGLDMGSARLDFLMKMPTVVMDMVILVTVVGYAGRRAGSRKGLLLGAAYALNPGIVYTVAYNGQLGDPLYSGLLAIAVAGLLSLQPEVAGVATVLAMATKPQAAAFLPFLALALLRYLPPRQLPRAIGAGAAAAALVLAPFVVAGTWPHMLRTVLTTVGHGPRIVSNALNVWWLWGWGDAWSIKDTGVLVGPLTYRTAGFALFFGAAYGLVAWRLWRAPERRHLGLVAAFVGLCFFMLPTEIHENYLFPTLPLLALAAVHDRRALYAGAALSVTWFLNMVSYDQTLLPRLTAALPWLPSALFPLQVALAVVNVLALAAMVWWVVHLAPGPSPHRAPRIRRPGRGEPEAPRPAGEGLG